MTHPSRISLMAAGELRTALEAHQRGDTATAVAALMAIDPESWQAIEQRLTALGGNVAALVSTLNRTT
ncbi:hypothetical protein RM844_27480 [Streptomyces sp. DSM 44915]|uniref:Uncharacterized protein n=1 Tax=Streptomyces chisholmiae TaxID=3075540 RepID=A0ABU2JYF4_9ACTN|nr:hypothetical protein [Streptomyces sp. DSM 44915]MDT0270027.1 hypothetical protein [Streptomyces sp. DSM 44915]